MGVVPKDNPNAGQCASSNEHLPQIPQIQKQPSKVKTSPMTNKKIGKGQPSYYQQQSEEKRIN